MNHLDLAEKFANIGATFVAENGELKEVLAGIAVADSLVQWNIPINADTPRLLADAFRRMIDIAATDLFPDRTWGIWLDVANSQYQIESGKLFFNVDDAIDYGIEHEQRAIYDMTLGKVITLVPAVIEVP